MVNGRFAFSQDTSSKLISENVKRQALMRHRLSSEGVAVRFKGLIAPLLLEISSYKLGVVRHSGSCAAAFIDFRYGGRRGFRISLRGPCLLTPHLGCTQIMKMMMSYFLDSSTSRIASVVNWKGREGSADCASNSNSSIDSI